MYCRFERWPFLTTGWRPISRRGDSGRLEDYPEAVQERLRALQVRLKAEGRFWQPRPRLFSERPTGPAWRNRITGTLIALVVMVILVSIGVGLYSMVRWLIAAGAG